MQSLLHPKMEPTSLTHKSNGRSRGILVSTGVWDKDSPHLVIFFLSFISLKYWVHYTDKLCETSEHLANALFCGGEFIEIWSQLGCVTLGCFQTFPSLYFLTWNVVNVIMLMGHCEDYTASKTQSECCLWRCRRNGRDGDDEVDNQEDECLIRDLN